MYKRLLVEFGIFLIFLNFSCQQYEEIEGLKDEEKVTTLSGGDSDGKAIYAQYKDFVINKTPFKDVLWDYKLKDEKIVNAYVIPYALIVETASCKLFYFESNGNLKWTYHLDRNLWIPPAYVVQKPYKVKEIERKIEQQKEKVSELRVGLTEQTQGQLEEAEVVLANLRREWESEDNSDYLYVITGMQLHCLYRKHGGVVWTRNLKFTPSGKPVALTTAVYVPAFRNDRLYILSPKDGYEVDWFNVGSAIQSGMFYKEPKLYFATEDGRVYMYSPDSGEYRKINEAEKRITGALVNVENTIYFGSVDYAVYAIDTSGPIIWKFETGGPIWKGVSVAGDLVIAYSHTKGLYGIDAKTGTQKFLLPSGDDYIAHGKNFVYLRMNDGGVATVRPDNGKIVNWYSDVPFEIFKFDPDEKIVYVISKTGYICATRVK